MTRLFQPYIMPILVAIAVFPVAVGLTALPYIKYHVRKFGGISLLKTVIFYSFLLYLMCAYALTILPLPSVEQVLAMPKVHVCFVPFRNLYEGLCDFGFDPVYITSLFSCVQWSAYLQSSAFFQIVANIAMLVPLGIYLRYYFSCSWKKTVLISFLVSLLFELTQLSGLFFLYPQPYRCPDLNDLLTNTLGGLLGYGLAPLLTWFLPARAKLDRPVNAEAQIAKSQRLLQCVFSLRCWLHTVENENLQFQGIACSENYNPQCVESANPCTTGGSRSLSGKENAMHSGNHLFISCRFWYII